MLRKSTITHRLMVSACAAPPSGMDGIRCCLPPRKEVGAMLGTSFGLQLLGLQSFGLFTGDEQ